MEKVLLFIPTYNCEKQIQRVLDQLLNPAINFIAETIVVNNQSTDNTQEVVCAFSKAHPECHIKVLRNKSNYNLGGSHKVAFHYALDNHFDYVIVLHGDDQGNLSDLMPVFKKGLHRQHDCILGARFMKGSKLEGYSTFRTFGNYVYNGLFSIVMGQRIYDLGSGLNIYAVNMLKDNFYHQFPDRLTFNYCMIMAAHYYGHNSLFVPISWRELDQVSNVKMTSQALNVLIMLLKYGLNNRKFITSELRDENIEHYEADQIEI